MTGKPYHDPDILRRLYQNKGMSTREIADRFNVVKGTVDYHMNKHGIERRDPPGKRPPTVYTTRRGYERVDVHDGESRKSITIHRLIAVAEHGFEAVSGNDTHHKNGVPWDNRPSNLEVLSRSEHTRKHNLSSVA